jgi:hypothetical protein
VPGVISALEGVEAGLEQALCGRRISGGGHDAVRGAQQGCWLAPNQLHISAIGTEYSSLHYLPVSKERDYCIKIQKSGQVSLFLQLIDMVCFDFKTASHYEDGRCFSLLCSKLFPASPHMESTINV